MRSITYQQVLLVLGLIAGIIVAQRFAPGIGESVVSVVGLVIAYILPSPFKATAPDAPKPPDAGPLAVIFALVFAGAMVTGCVGGYAGVDKLEDEITHTSDLLDTCKQRARIARANDASSEDALAVFDRCVASDGGAK